MTAIALRPPGRIVRPTVILAGLAAVVVMFALFYTLGLALFTTVRPLF